MSGWTPIGLEFLDEVWKPNIFIYDLGHFKTAKVLKQLAGAWIVGREEIYFNQCQNDVM